ncbi:UNVERIFIED_CONTAM: hypothetical protein Sindi_3025600, partial [Sesamum indicum]
MPPIPHGRARAPPLLPFLWDASQFGKQFFNHPHHLTRLHRTPPRRLQMTLKHLELDRQRKRGYSNLSPRRLLHHYHQHAQYISLDDA